MRPSGTSSTRNSVLEDHLAIIYRKKGMKHFKKIDLYVDLPMLKLQDLGTTCKKWLNKGVDEVNIHSYRVLWRYSRARLYGPRM